MASARTFLRVGLALPLAAGFVLAACSPPVAIQPIAHATHLRVVTNVQGVIGTIDDPKRLQALVDFVNARRDGWEPPFLADTPVAPIYVEICDGTSFVAKLGVSRKGFVWESPPFLWRDARTDEIDAVRKLLGIDTLRFQRLIDFQDQPAWQIETVMNGPCATARQDRRS